MNSLFSTTPNYNASLATVCHPFLFEGQFSREEKPMEIYGMCPDTIFTPILTAIFYFIYLLITLLSFIGLIWKRNSKHITERHPLSLLFSLTGNLIFESILNIRFIVGRPQFPCILYSSVYFLFSASIFLPMCYKCFRLYFKHKLSQEKIELYTIQREMDLELVSAVSMIGPTTTNGNSMENTATTTPTTQDKSAKIIEKKKRLIKLYSFLLSAKFLVPTVAIILFLHVALWVSVGVSDEVVEKKTFFVDGGTFAFTRGCSIDQNTSIIVICEAVFYIVFETVFVILLMRTDKDIWSIKKETLVIVVVQAIVSIMYIVGSQIDIIFELVDYILPVGNTILFYCTVEQFVTIVLPVIYSIRYDMRKSEEIAMEVAIKLKEGVAYDEEMLDIARRSYHPEQMLAWYDMEYFKTGKIPTTRETALNIINLYLVSRAPLNINLPEKYLDNVLNLQKIANDDPSQLIPRDMFDGAQAYCFNDMCQYLRCTHTSEKYTLNEEKLFSFIY